MSLLPCIQDSNFVEGSVIQLLPYCRKNCSSTKCKGHYVKLGISAPGFYMCPNGLSSLVCISSKGRRVIYSGIRVKGFYDKRKAHISQSSDNIYNPVLRQEQLLSLAKEDIEINEKLMAISEKEEAVNDVLHETRKFNAQIKSICDIIWDEYHNYAQTPPRDLKNLFKYIQTIHVYSYLAYNRFAHYDISTNPEHHLVSLTKLWYSKSLISYACFLKDMAKKMCVFTWPIRINFVIRFIQILKHYYLLY